MADVVVRGKTIGTGLSAKHAANLAANSGGKVRANPAKRATKAKSVPAKRANPARKRANPVHALEHLRYGVYLGRDGSEHCTAAFEEKGEATTYAKALHRKNPGLFIRVIDRR